MPNMKQVVIAFALFLNCSISVAVAQTWPPVPDQFDKDNLLLVAVRDAEAYQSVSESIPVCGTPECYATYLRQKKEELSVVVKDAKVLTTNEEKADFLSKNYWFKQAQLRVASYRMCMIGGDDGCVVYANQLFSAYNDASQTEMNAPSRSYLLTERTSLSDKSCKYKNIGERCLIETVVEVLDAACARSSAMACLALVEKWPVAERLGLETMRKPPELLERACELGEPSACWSIVQNSLRRTSAWTQETIDLATKSCGMGIKDACLLIAHSRKHGKLGMKADQDEAMKFLTATYCTMLQFSDVQCDMKFKEL